MASSHYKFKRKVLAQAVTAACLSMSANAWAGTGSCPAASNIITTSETTACGLLTGDSVTVNASPGEIAVNTGDGAITIIGTSTAPIIAGTITNSGVISNAVAAGIYLQGDAQSGAILNMGGTISGQTYGIEATTNNIIAGITNDGTISGGADGIYFGGNGGTTTGIINNTGATISGGNNGIYFTGSDTGQAGGITNGGTISGGLESGIMISGSTVGAITNNVGGAIAGANNGISLLSSSTTVDSITNKGSISGSGNSGIYLQLGAQAGAILNNTGGSISGQIHGIEATSGNIIASITNDGTISGTDYDGIYFGAGGGTDTGIINSAGATISGGNNGIYFTGSGSGQSGGITNSGTISGTTGDGIAVFGSAFGALVNNASGIIEGANNGISILSGSVIDSITNNGTISGIVGIAVHTGSAVSSITNNAGGIIRGTGSVAIDMGGADTTVPMTINNSGLLDGSVTLENSILNLQGVTGSITGSVNGTVGSIVNVEGAFSTASTFSVGTFNISNGGVLNMAHDITAAILNNAGTLSIAEVPQTFTGNYDQLTTGIFKIGASSTSVTNYGQLVINGTATLPDNAKIGVNLSSGHTLREGNTLASVLRATTLTARTFNVYDNSLSLRFVADVVGNAINLTTVSTGMSTLANAATSSGITSTAGVAGVLDPILSAGNSTGELKSALYELTSLNTAAEVANAMKQLTPILQGGAAQSTVAVLRSGATHVVHEMMQDTIGLSAGDEVRSGSAGWIKPFASRARQDDRNGASGYRASSYGLVLGKDNRISEQWKIGGAVSYSSSRVNSNGTQHIDIGTHQVDLYATDHLDEATALRLQLGWGKNRNTSQRAVFGYVASGNYNSTHMLMNAELERLYQINDEIRLTPWLGVQYAHIKVKGYSEAGAASLNLVVDGQNESALVISAGGKAAYKLNDESKLVGHLSVGYDTQAKQAAVTSSFSSFGGSTFVTSGIKPSPVVIRTGMSYEVEKANGTEIATRYDLDTKSGYTNHMLSINWRMLF